MKSKYKKVMESFTISNDTKDKFIESLENADVPKKSFVPYLAAAAAVIIIVAAALPTPKVNISPTASAEDEPEHPIVINEYSSQESSSYEVVVSLKAHKLSEFSTVLQGDIASGRVERAFDTKQELEAYLGISLIAAPELENAEIVPDVAQSYEYNFEIIRPQYEFAPEARYVVTGVDYHGSISAHPEIIKVSIHRVIRNTECYIDALILTEYAETNGGGVAVLAESFPALTGLHNNSWFDENGEYQIESIQYSSALKNFAIKEFEMENGCIATIVTATDVCPICLNEKCEGYREYRGHFVADGVLYSVLPLGIADPTQSFPIQDSDCLSVLKSVLKLFE
ncbi:MAG: hypothetical protein IKZ30_03980 [Oscillospiraceae bacterium]|nr:hypothetical protein [Oscillospiraceae bacterium]